MFFFCLFEQSHLIYGGSWHRCQFLKKRFSPRWATSICIQASNGNWHWNFHFAWPAMDSCGNTSLDVGVPVHRWLMPVGSDLTLWKQCDDLGVCSAKMNGVNQDIKMVNENLIEHSNKCEEQISVADHKLPNNSCAAFRLFLRNIRGRYCVHVLSTGHEISMVKRFYWRWERERETIHLCRCQSACNLRWLTSKNVYINRHIDR